MSARSFGSITLESTGRYRARYTGPDGKRYSAGRFAIRRAAQRELNRIEDRIDTRTWVSPAEERRAEAERRAEDERRSITVAAWAECWLAAGTRRWAPRTLRDHRARLRRRILPVLGNQPLGAVTAEEIDRWYEALTEATTAGVPRPVYMTLRAMYAAAVKARMCIFSPVQVEGDDRHRPVREEARVLSRAEADRLASSMSPRMRLAVWVGLWCGLRRAEIVGLQAGDFDFESRLFHVRRQVITEEERVPRRIPGERPAMKFAPPKYGSIRTVGLPTFMVTIVQEHINALADSSASESDARLFPGRCATGTIHPNRMGGCIRECGSRRQAVRFHPAQHEAHCAHLGRACRGHHPRIDGYRWSSIARYRDAVPAQHWRAAARNR